LSDDYNSGAFRDILFITTGPDNGAGRAAGVVTGACALTRDKDESNEQEDRRESRRALASHSA